jgi:putative SOS response-associated peptidase YedK
MCGRFVQAQRPEFYAEHFGVEVMKTASLAPSWNVAPTDEVYAVAEHSGQRLLGTFRWGLLPWWAKDRKAAARNINARSETAAEKPAFRDSFVSKRCLIPADGFFEWERKPKGKLPHFIHAVTDEPLALAGLWSSWRDPETDERVRTCTILTGDPNDLVAKLHNRMPIVLDRPAWDVWLDPSTADREDLEEALRHSAPPLAEYAVSTLVNKVANNVPECIAPLETGAVEA